jgi:hypothetical protein
MVHSVVVFCAPLVDIAFRTRTPMEETELEQVSVAVWPTGCQQIIMPFDDLRSAFVIESPLKLLRVLWLVCIRLSWYLARQKSTGNTR